MVIGSGSFDCIFNGIKRYGDKVKDKIGETADELTEKAKNIIKKVVPGIDLVPPMPKIM